MAKKKIYVPKREEATAVEEPWMVVGDDNSPRPGRPIYLASELGISEEEARRLAAGLRNACAVPR